MIDIEYLRRHYADLSDDALAEIAREDLVEAARRCYDEEAARRRPERHGRADPPRSVKPMDFEEGGAACACVFSDHPGSHAAEDAAEARQVLAAAGLPCRVAREQGDPPEWRVLVPGARELEAMSILDCEIFNPRLETEWRAHFDDLPEDDLRRLDVEAMCAGLLDRVRRLRKAYEDAMRERRLST